MSTEIGSYEAKTKLPEILRRVESGEVFTITNRGKAVAELIPSRLVNRKKARLAVSNLIKNLKVKISDDEFEELRIAGRK